MANQPTANPFALDSEIAALCVEPPPTSATEILCGVMGVTVDAYLAATTAAFQAACRQATRVFSGYRAADQRRAERHGLYSMGIRNPPRRPTVADRVAAEAVRWGHCS